uniref:Secreted protein n=1 Tax=Rousettus aegyptiacus TaxID=9407 RepID=A0A7J8FJD7_ROUAE|nr:hypothetical protein HJG63_012163 [Rousettus aegyptiacus]
MPLGASSCLLLACTLAIVPFLAGERVGLPAPWPSAHALLCICTAHPAFRHPAPPFSPCITHPSSHIPTRTLAPRAPRFRHLASQHGATCVQHPQTLGDTSVPSVVPAVHFRCGFRPPLADQCWEQS